MTAGDEVKEKPGQGSGMGAVTSIGLNSRFPQYARYHLHGYRQTLAAHLDCK